MPVTAAARVTRTAWRRGRLAWVLWAVAVLGLAVWPWFDRLLREADRSDLVLATPDVPAAVVGILSAVTVGAVLASRRPAHPVGWLLLTLGLSLVASGVATQYVSYGLLARPGALPAAAYVAIYPNGVALYVVAACLAFILLLTPTGTLPHGRTWPWWATLAKVALAVGVVASVPAPLTEPYQSVANPLAVPALTGLVVAAGAVSLAGSGLAILAAAWSLVVRYRRARSVERQQLRWIALAAVLTVAALLVLGSLLVAGISDPVLLGWATAVCITLLPLATGAAILRYRLYDLDRIISRTLAYGLLTVLLGLGYAGVVLGLGRLLPQGSSLAVAAATLAVAALFQPLRRRVQAAVDRRFNRRRHDATRIIEGFGTRLRDQVDLDTLTADLLAVVDQTMQPTQTSLWLRPPREPPRTPPRALASP
jgi:hypothetical protein